MNNPLPWFGALPTVLVLGGTTTLIGQTVTDDQNTFAFNFGGGDGKPKRISRPAEPPLTFLQCEFGVGKSMTFAVAPGDEVVINREGNGPIVGAELHFNLEATFVHEYKKSCGKQKDYYPKQFPKKVPLNLTFGESINLKIELFKGTLASTPYATESMKPTEPYARRMEHSTIVKLTLAYNGDETLLGGKRAMTQEEINRYAIPQLEALKRATPKYINHKILPGGEVQPGNVGEKLVMNVVTKRPR